MSKPRHRPQPRTSPVPRCRATVRGAKAAHSHCRGVTRALHERKPHSLIVTTVLVGLAPPLLLHTGERAAGDETRGRSCTMTRYDHERRAGTAAVRDPWPIALLVFVRQHRRPSLEDYGVGVLLYSAWRPSPHRRCKRSELYRMVEFIGRWSMLDIYAIFAAGHVGAGPVLWRPSSWAGRMGLRRRGGLDPASRRGRSTSGSWDYAAAWTEPPAPSLGRSPAAVPARSRWSRLPLIWMLPAVVILLRAPSCGHEKLAQGTSIEILSKNAEDLEANKTKIRYKEVEIGDVRDIHVSRTSKGVVVTAMIHRDASEIWWKTPLLGGAPARPRAAGVYSFGDRSCPAPISAVDVGKSASPASTSSVLKYPRSSPQTCRAAIHGCTLTILGSLDMAPGLLSAYHRRPGVGYALDPGRRRRHAHDIRQRTL